MGCVQRFWALRSGGFRSTKFQFITKVYSKHKAPSLHVSPPDAKPVLVAVNVCFHYTFHHHNIRNFRL